VSDIRARIALRHHASHAAPVGRPAALSPHVGRALRLIAIAAAWIIGLCLVLAAVAFVAGISGPHVTHVRTVAHQSRTAAPGPGRP
jgi:hypothetical protein